MKLPEFKTYLLNSEFVSALDCRFAGFIQDLGDCRSDELWICAALVSAMTRSGHICLDCAALTDPHYLATILQEPEKISIETDTETVISALKDCRVVGQTGTFHPLILDDNLLYLYRYWDYQNRLADYINANVNVQQLQTPQQIDRLLVELFPPDDVNADPWQKQAARVAITHKFCVISGGPGTGKTYTAGKILAALIAGENNPALKIKLAAPTGKAAMRLQDSIRSVKQAINCQQEIKALIPEEASTVHRLLGTKRHSPYFMHDSENPVDVDVLVIDEASMIDLALIGKLVSALPQHTRLILLGDNHQLASVEAGSVLADICGPQNNKDKHGDSGISGCIVRLQTTHRFSGDSAILKLSQAVNEGKAEDALAILSEPQTGDADWHDLHKENLMHVLLSHFRDYRPERDLAAAFRQIEEFRILCAVRMGPAGVSEINNAIEKFIKSRTGIAQSEIWYAGRPVLITENDYELGLFNGDVGIAGGAQGSEESLRVYFADETGSFKSFRPFRLPQHETAFAMTVHKSQGSEFKHVLLILPEKDNPLLTRELIYTAITRASKSVEIWADRSVFQQAVKRRIQRSSGLQKILWNS
jgi:exodeoxyribonuclease V alpha subunit